MTFKTESDCEKAIKLCKDNNIVTELQPALLNFLKEEAEFRLKEVDPDCILLDENGNDISKNESVINKLANHFYESDYILDNDSIYNLTTEFLWDNNLAEYNKNDIVFIDINI